MSSASDSEEARRILDTEVYQRAVHNARVRLKEEWGRCKTGPEQREALWHAYQQVDSVTRELRVIIDNRHMELTKNG